MSGIEDLIHQLDDLERRAGRCVRCGACQAVCPLFSETRHETDVARGKMILMEGIRDHMFNHVDAAADRIHRCLLCGSCATVCSSGLPVVNTFLQARRILAEYQGLPLYQKILLRGILSRPQRLDRTVRWLRTIQPWISRRRKGIGEDKHGTRLIRGLSRRSMPVLPRRSFHQAIGPGLDTTGPSSIRVAFFTGCLINHVFPEVAEAALKVFQHSRVGVYLPVEQACCGMPAMAAGDMDAFRRVLYRNLELFDPSACDAIVTACATCAAAIRHFWPMMSEGEPVAVREKIRAISERTRDIHEWILQSGLQASGLPESMLGARVTYHDPCHLKKTLGIYMEPRRILKAISGIEFLEMKSADACCGMGGSFNLAHHDLSVAIGQRKAENIDACGANIVATSCPACMLQLRDVLSRSGSSVNVRHVVELYAEGLKGEAPSRADCRHDGDEA